MDHPHPTPQTKHPRIRVERRAGTLGGRETSHQPLWSAYSHYRRDAHLRRDGADVLWGWGCQLGEYKGSGGLVQGLELGRYCLILILWYNFSRSPDRGEWHFKAAAAFSSPLASQLPYLYVSSNTTIDTYRTIPVHRTPTLARLALAMCPLRRLMHIIFSSVSAARIFVEAEARSKLNIRDCRSMLTWADPMTNILTSVGPSHPIPSHFRLLGLDILRYLYTLCISLRSRAHISR